MSDGDVMERDYEMGIVDGRASSVVKGSRDKEHAQLMYPHARTVSSPDIGYSYVITTSVTAAAKPKQRASDYNQVWGRLMRLVGFARISARISLHQCIASVVHDEIA